MTEKYSHLHSIWKADMDDIISDMISRGIDPYAKEPGKIIKPYAICENNRYRLPTIKLLDKHFRCWWWNSIDKFWEYKFYKMIGTNSLDENDYIKNDCLKYHKDGALKLLNKGITHFIPFIVDCPPLLFCDPLIFEECENKIQQREVQKQNEI